MNKRILCFGDSNTWGYVPGGNGERYSKGVRWAGRLQSLLGSGYEVFEEGLPYRTINQTNFLGLCQRGMDVILPCLKQYAPLDLVILMLGTNDVRDEFGVDCWNITRSMGQMMDVVQSAGVGRDGQAPKLLLMGPAPIRKGVLLSAGAREFDLSEETVRKSEQLDAFYRPLAKEYGAEYLYAGDYVTPSFIDCLHYDVTGHTALADGVAQKVRTIL